MAFAVSTIIGAAGLALTAGGMYMNYSNQKKAAEANAAAAEKQGEISRLQAGNVDNTRELYNLQTEQQLLQIKTQKDVIAQQQQADELRQQASVLDATRRRRDAIRQGIVAQSQSLTSATNQGAAAPGSTALAQSTASIAGQTGVNLLGVSQNLEIGQKLFAINKNITSIYLNAQDQNMDFVSKSKEIQNRVFDTQKQVYSLGGSIASDYATAATAQGNAAFGAGISSLGQAIVSNYPTINRITNYFGSGGSGSSGNNYGYSANTYGNGYT